MINRVVLLGRICNDPDTKFTPAGVQVTSFRIAVNRTTKDENGKYEADFFDVVCWRKTAEFVANYLSKGRLVSVDGRLQSRSWVAQDGTKRSKVEIVGDNVNGEDPKGDSGAPSADAGAGYQAAPTAPTAPAAAAAKPGASAPASLDETDLDETDPFVDE